MALFNCLECNREISDKAVRCPGCGAPVSSHVFVPYPVVQVAPGEDTGFTLGIVALALLVTANFLPFFAAVLVLPAAITCTIISYNRGWQGLGCLGIFFSVLMIIGIAEISNRIQEFFKGRGSKAPTQSIEELRDSFAPKEQRSRSRRE